MLEYGQTVDDARGGRFEPVNPLAFSLASLLAATRLFVRHGALILVLAVVGALTGIGLSKLLTPRYVATAQIYVDPHGLPGVDKEGTPSTEDSNGFINYVESQSLIITSRIVLERVVAKEKLDRDDEFVGMPSLLMRLLPEGPKAAEDSVDAATRTLAGRIAVHRPERTFVIDLSLSSRDPEKAARLANAVANTFIEAQSAVRSEFARQATASLAGQLETLRSQLMAAEKRLEDFKARNGLVGTRDQLVTEQQLRAMTDQVTAAHARVEEARSRYDQILAARSTGNDIGAIAVGLNLASLPPLRSLQAEAKQKLADLSAELGPKHPLVKDAAARVVAADRVVDAELARVAEGARNDLARTREVEAAVSGDFDHLKQQTLANDQTSVGLRDLQREADAARSVYDLFVTRSRQTGDIQQFDVLAPSMRIVSLASTPKDRSFPPRSSLLGGAGLAFGLAVGFALATNRERRHGESNATRYPGEGRWNDASRRNPSSATSFPARGSRTAPLERAPIIAISARGAIERRERRQSIEHLDLRGLGFVTFNQAPQQAELRSILDACDLFARLKSDGRRRSVAIVGGNESGFRSALAINLALTLGAEGFRVALIDAMSRDARITRAVRQTTNSPMRIAGVFFDTLNGILLALPKGHDGTPRRLGPAGVMRYLIDTADEDIDAIICDGPGSNEIDADLIFDMADDILLVEALRPPLDGGALAPQLADVAGKVRAIVSFKGIAPADEKTR
jgi:uncharacterized protein involved in exopolysaccharide biosynthesis/Mrp family chromosome partitioning ATPase